MDSLCNNFDKLSFKNSGKYTVLSIDIGVQHFGINVSMVNEDYTLDEIIWIDLIDITKYCHKNGPSLKECKLHHTRTFSDWLEHVYQENKNFFEDSDIILVERQPPGGFTVIEQLIFNRYRDKTYLINPRNVHSYLSISHLDYENRKKYVEKAAYLYLSENFKEQIKKYDREHDICDSVCILLYWLNKMNKEYRINEQKKISFDKNKNILEYLESFRFVPKE